jgi:TRAP-type mannitol/chloroaromatic compound transport system substrate-binding protein
VQTFPEPVMTAIRQANDELLKENAANDPFAAKVLQSQQAYMAKIRQWTLMSEKAYLDSTQ